MSALARKTNEFDYKCTTEKKIISPGGWNRTDLEYKNTLKWPQQDNQSENVNVCERQLRTVSNYLREEKQAEGFTLKH